LYSFTTTWYYGATFAVGIAFTSVWFPKERQGLALGIFGAGNAGAAATTLFAPTLLKDLVADGNMDAWRELPLMYAGMLVGMAIIFFLLTVNKKPDSSGRNPFGGRMVWRTHFKEIIGGFGRFKGYWLLNFY